MGYEKWRHLSLSSRTLAYPLSLSLSLSFSLSLFLSLCARIQTQKSSAQEGIERGTVNGEGETGPFLNFFGWGEEKSTLLELERRRGELGGLAEDGSATFDRVFINVPYTVQAMIA